MNEMENQITMSEAQQNVEYDPDRMPLSMAFELSQDFKYICLNCGSTVGEIMHFYEKKVDLSLTFSMRQTANPVPLPTRLEFEDIEIESSDELDRTEEPVVDTFEFLISCIECGNDQELKWIRPDSAGDRIMIG